MSYYIESTKRKLRSSITQLCDTSWMFVKDPERDFTRKRKLPLSAVISALLCMEGGSLTNELLRYFGCNQHTASGSAFIQQRQKINEFAFPALFDLFIKQTDTPKQYKGFRLFAADGSDIQVPTNPDDTESYFPGSKDQQPYNLLHLDAVYDLLQHTYVDAELNGKRGFDESGTLRKMVDRSPAHNVIVIADRNYENYNLMAHIQEKGWKYLIRIKDIHSSGIAAGLPLPDKNEFDVFFPMHLTKRQNAEAKQRLLDKNRYKLLPTSTTFDFLPAQNRKHDPFSSYYLPFRVVRFPISENSFEVVITNLDPERFPPEELKLLYGMRWGIETAFRELKYTIGLLHFHAKKVEYICQEVFARLIMYNFSELITSHVVIQKTNRKYPCKANFSVAVQVCRQFLLGNVSPPDVEAVIRRYLSPIRTGRSRPRNVAAKKAVSFLYRVA